MLVLSSGFVPRLKTDVLGRYLLLSVEKSIVDKPTQNPIGKNTRSIFLLTLLEKS